MLERNAINPRIKRRKLKKPLEFMNAKARRAELSKMIDGERRKEYSNSASKAEFLCVHTQIAIITYLRWKTIIKIPEIKKKEEKCNNKKDKSRTMSTKERNKMLSLIHI